MSNNLIQPVHKFLSILGIKISKAYLAELLKSHPDYPSLLCITDTLDELGIENLSLIVDKDKLDELPLPFLTHSPLNGGGFVVITNIEQHFVNDDAFTKSWDGIVVLAEKPAVWKHEQNEKILVKEKYGREKLSLFLAVIFIMAIISLAGNLTFSLAGLFLATLAGLGLAVLIVLQKLGLTNEITEQLCNANAETDCDAVMNSQGSKISSWFSWADAGIVYFSSYLFTLILQPDPSLLPYISAAAMPFVLYSVYYQWRVIKKWCTLCLLTVSVLVIQFLIQLPALLPFNIDVISINNIAFPAFIFSAVSTIWLLLIWPLLQQNKELTEQKFSLQRFKNSPDIFNSLLEKQKKVTHIPEGMGITIGNTEANNTIIKVCNPYCNPCSKAHKKIDELLALKSDLKVQILYTASGDESDKKTKPVKHFLAIQEMNKPDLLQQALDDWYLANEKDYEVFAAKYQLNGELDAQHEKIKLMKAWCDEVKIEFTPTFFINGHQLPKKYRIEDLKYYV